jgi:hypothetical protein
VNANDLTVYLIGDREEGRPWPASGVAGRFVLRELQWSGAAGSGDLRMSLHFTRAEDKVFEGSRFVWIEVEVETTQIPTRRRGLVTIEREKRPQLHLAGTQSLEWSWRLLPEDVEAIEAGTPPESRWRNFRLNVSGIAQLSSGIFPFTGSSDFRVPLSEWEDLLTALGYTVAPSASQLVGLSVATHPSWAEAERRLAPARQALRAGETYRAMTSCLSEFARLVDKPYKSESWLPRLPNDPAQKKASAANLLAAHCTYLNRVGYHLGGDQEDNGDLQPMPLDHWEAEVAVAASQFWLTLALRETKTS